MTAKFPESPVSHAGESIDPKIESAKATLELAQASLAKLPIMGPALWLYARDQQRRFAFVGDIDWMLLPPVVLDQCRIFTRASLPVAFFSWAFVSDAIDERLRAGGRLAPHEWQSGQHAWFMDMVMPFGVEDELVNELLQTVFVGRPVKAMVSDPKEGGKLVLRTWPAAAPKTTQH